MPHYKGPDVTIFVEKDESRVLVQLHENLKPVWSEETKDFIVTSKSFNRAGQGNTPSEARNSLGSVLYAILEQARRANKLREVLDELLEQENWDKLP